MASSTGTTAGRKRLIKTCVGELTISEQQAKKLDIKPRKRLSPQIEKSCLLLSLAERVTCVGDGHPGIWKLMSGIKEQHSRREVLDWYHLMENLHKIGGSEQRLKQVRAELWTGSIAAAKAAFSDWNSPPKEVDNFLAYLEGHQDRIPNYKLYQKQGLCIGSGAVESTIKRISVRIKISGSQWNTENLGNVLKQRCEYLNRHVVSG